MTDGSMTDALTPQLSADQGTDGRRVRGDRTRTRVAQRAAELASMEGLSGLTLGRLASDLRLSKSGVAALYGSKQKLQLAAIASARDAFVEHVVTPTLDTPPGIPRLLALIDTWLGYVEAPVFPGGCFMVATAAEFDSRPGPVRDALAKLRRNWLALLTKHVEHAQAEGRVRELPAALIAFEIDGLLAAANISANLLDDPGALRAARDVLRVRLGGPTSGDSLTERG